MKRENTPLQRGARAIDPEWFGETVYDAAWNCERHILDNYPGQHKNYQNAAMVKARAALTAALKVRWELRSNSYSKSIISEESALIGNLCCGYVRHWVHPGMGPEPHQAWILSHDSDDGLDLGCFATIAEAKAAVERVVIEAILG